MIATHTNSRCSGYKCTYQTASLAPSDSFQAVCPVCDRAMSFPLEVFAPEPFVPALGLA